MSETTPPVSPLQSADPKARKASRRPKRRRPPTTEELRDQAEATLGSRETVIVASGHEALAIYRSELRFGSLPDKPVYPKGHETRSRLVGDPVRRQVAIIVRTHVRFVDWKYGRLTDDQFAHELEIHMPWQLFEPWEGLCEAEIEAMGQPREADDDPEGRLMPGMRRAE